MNMQNMNAPESKLVAVPCGERELSAELVLIPDYKGLVILAYGSGDAAMNERTKEVAKALNKAGVSTFLVDLLIEEEEMIDNMIAEFRENVDMLSKRLGRVTDWISSQPELANFKLGYYGANMITAADIHAAAQHPDKIHAIVSRAGRVDLGGEALKHIQAPTLLLAGELDETLINLNQYAEHLITAPHQLIIVPGATHLIEEPAPLAKIYHYIIDWFSRYLSV